MTLVAPPPRLSLVRVSLDVGRALADRDGVVFRARGTCMYPAIRPGDVLHVRSRSAAEMALGDLAVCRTPDGMFCHRVVGKGEREGQTYIVTRADRSRRESDGPTIDDDLLGVVVEIVRRGRAVPRSRWAAASESAAVTLRFGQFVVLQVLEAAPRARVLSAGALAWTQDRAAYRRLAGRFFTPAADRLSYTVRLPLNATLGEAVYRELDAGEFRPADPWRGRPVDRWMLVLHLDGGRTPAAWATFVRNAKGDWVAREDGVHLRARHRGLGLEQAVRQRASQIVGERT